MTACSLLRTVRTALSNINQRFGKNKLTSELRTSPVQQHEPDTENKEANSHGAFEGQTQLDFYDHEESPKPKCV